ncbi:MAG: protein-L-isoaspartate(D-aspartate) O-methyltransferase [bacterium]|nr:protein-L-isoaspartate(D-aspartate) O-methyltransferase [bacterium]
MVREQLIGRGITDEQVLAAMASVPREEFVSARLRASAYEDSALPVGPGQSISQPYIVAYMSEKLEVAPGQRILEVGSGTGYQAAILSAMGAGVDSIEADPQLARAAQNRLRRLSIRGVRFHYGDGSLGLPPASPFERIVVTAGAPRIPPPLIEQLAEGGRLIVPVGSAERQVLLCVVKRGCRTTEHPLIPCRFVKLIGDQAWSA